MKERNGYLLLAEHREAKPAQFAGRLDRPGTLVDWQGLARAVNDATGLEGLRPKGGRPPYPTQPLLMIVVLQQLLGNPSDEEMEYCPLDRMRWQTFTGLAGHRHLPDTRTIWAFKELLAEDGGAEALFEIVGEQLAAAGLKVRGLLTPPLSPSPRPTSGHSRLQRQTAKDLQVEIARLEPWQVIARSQEKTEEFVKFTAEAPYKSYS